MMRQIEPGPLVQKLFAMVLRVSKSCRACGHSPALPFPFPFPIHDNDWKRRDVEPFRDVLKYNIPNGQGGG